MRASGCAAALAVASWLGLGPALAATFVLADGSTITGTIVHATRNTVTIRPAIGGLRQVPVGRLERVEALTADGRTLRGRYRGWVDGRAEIAVGADLLWLENDRVVARRPPTAPALATAPGHERSASGRAPSAALAAAGEPATEARSPGSAASAPAGGSAAAAETPRSFSAVSGPLPPWPEARADPAPGGSAASAPGPEPAAGPVMAALPAGDLPVVSITTSPQDVSEQSGTIAFTIELSRPVDDLLVVIYSTVDGTARAGAHYQPLQGILTLPAGVTSAQIETAVIDDAERGGDKEFQLFLASNPEVVTVARPWTKVTIRDDD